MIGEIAAAISSIKALSEQVSKMKESAEKRNLSAALNDVHMKFHDLHSRITEATQARAEAEKRAVEAEEKCTQIENWQRESERYVMKEIIPGVFAYSLKIGMQQGEPMHFLCANCYTKGQKSILQLKKTGRTLFNHVCHNCSCVIQAKPI